MTWLSIAQRLRDWAAPPVVRPSGPPPRPTRRNLLFDAGLALVLAVAAVWYAVDGSDSPVLVVQDVPAPGLRPPPLPGPAPDTDTRIQGALTALACSAALVLRRRFPLTVLCIVFAITTAVVSDEPRLTFYALVVAAYSAAAYSPYRVPTIAVVVVTAVVVTIVHDAALPVVPSKYVPLMVLVPIVVAADGLRRWKLRVEQGRVRMEELEREQAEAVRRAAEDERARLARELHDVVTHNVSVMVIQAGAARKVMASAPEQASEALLAVESGGRAAMADLRQVMGLLSRDGGDPDADDSDDLTPQPGLDRLPSLVDRVREAGLPAELTVAGRVRPLPPGIELAAYRVVQEALTNTMKHATGAAATVTVDYGDDRLRVEVADTGGTPVASARSGDGRGLIGLRERLAVHDGTLVFGRRLTGGYRVEAVIPVEAS
ncbi:sensor histidine kinase [Jiangella aurantiaca]|uniref:histidine kinase n=1 Tax=Jiangella aurantiaca TaxID=2530373 RepID=A0A4R5AFT5_9ACTN|nr:histidine kinase [Jiangella aurantiaca]TDD70455.1 sensor histidine kinase [Jiangella aurantiaca]